MPDEAGEIVTTDGEILGRHSGVHNFTIGQRKGLGVAAGRPLYVIAIDRAFRRIVVGEDAELRSTECEVRDINWISLAALIEPTRAMVKIRHRHEPAAALLTPSADPARARLIFEEPQRAITPGQGAVFYVEETVLGGGWIV